MIACRTCLRPIDKPRGAWWTISFDQTVRFNSRDEAQARRVQGLSAKQLVVLLETDHRTNAMHGVPQGQRDRPQARSALCKPTSTAGVPATGLVFNQRRL